MTCLVSRKMTDIMNRYSEWVVGDVPQASELNRYTSVAVGTGHGLGK